jgi:hypothetical protein
MTTTTNKTAPTPRETIDDALVRLEEMDGDEAWKLVDKVLGAVYFTLKQDARFRGLSHDAFDALTATVRERLAEELDEHIGRLVPIEDVYRILDRTLGDE